MKIWNLGYPRLGSRNEWYPAVQQFELGLKTSDQLLEMGKTVLQNRWKTQHELGVDNIPLNDFCIWDSVLDTACLFNLVPQEGAGDHWLSSQLLLTRRLNRINWFRTPYRCFQPEWDGKKSLSLKLDKLNWEINCQKGLPYQFHVSLVGPWTLTYLTKTANGSKAELAKELVPLYSELLKDLKKRGFDWVQLEEPAFCIDLQKEDLKTILMLYEGLKGQLPKILISTCYESPDPYLTELSQLPVQGFHYDLVAGPAVLSWIKTRSFPKDKLLGLGLVSATNIWSAQLASLYKQIEILKGFHPENKLLLSTSSSLIHLPVTKHNEKKLKENNRLFENISFANERLEELALLKQMLLGHVSLSEMEKRESEKKEMLQSLQKKNDSVRNQINRLDFSFRKRLSSYAKRSKIQSKRLNLPKLPFMVTGKEPEGLEDSVLSSIDITNYDSLSFEQRINDYSKRWTGLVATEEAWVQKCGSECIRPPILVSDIEWKDDGKDEVIWKPGSRIVKAVSVGPVTFVNHAYVRQDLPKEQVVLQAALAVRNEVKALEGRGAPIIEIDESFLTELLPLKKQKISVYLKHQMDNLKIAICGVKDETVIHLNIEHSDMTVLLEPLAKSEVDVLCFSSGVNFSEKLLLLKSGNVECGLSPGVADPVLGTSPNEKEIEINIRKCFEVIAPEKLWIRCVPAPELVRHVQNATQRIRRLLSGKS